MEGNRSIQVFRRGRWVPYGEGYKNQGSAASSARNLAVKEQTIARHLLGSEVLSYVVWDPATGRARTLRPDGYGSSTWGKREAEAVRARQANGQAEAQEPTQEQAQAQAEVAWAEAEAQDRAGQEGELEPVDPFRRLEAALDILTVAVEQVRQAAAMLGKAPADLSRITTAELLSEALGRQLDSPADALGPDQAGG